MVASLGASEVMPVNSPVSTSTPGSVKAASAGSGAAPSAGATTGWMGRS